MIAVSVIALCLACKKIVTRSFHIEDGPGVNLVQASSKLCKSANVRSYLVRLTSSARGRAFVHLLGPTITILAPGAIHFFMDFRPGSSRGQTKLTDFHQSNLDHIHQPYCSKEKQTHPAKY
ncbi:hypothetical protein SDJN02_05023, partial [Cucurbita argyrosperma subsp. argyrosperma]